MVCLPHVHLHTPPDTHSSPQPFLPIHLCRTAYDRRGTFVVPQGEGWGRRKKLKPPLFRKTVPLTTSLECRRPAFWLERAVTKPTVRLAGQELADHLVGATRNEAWIDTAAVLGTETLAFRRGGATRHRARLVLLTAVFDAML